RLVEQRGLLLRDVALKRLARGGALLLNLRGLARVLLRKLRERVRADRAFERPVAGKRGGQLILGLPILLVKLRRVIIRIVVGVVLIVIGVELRKGAVDRALILRDILLRPCGSLVGLIRCVLRGLLLILQHLRENGVLLLLRLGRGVRAVNAPEEARNALHAHAGVARARTPGAATSEGALRPQGHFKPLRQLFQAFLIRERDETVPLDVLTPRDRQKAVLQGVVALAHADENGVRVALFLGLGPPPQPERYQRIEAFREQEHRRALAGHVLDRRRTCDERDPAADAAGRQRADARSKVADLGEPGVAEFGLGDRM